VLNCKLKKFFSTVLITFFSPFFLSTLFIWVVGFFFCNTLRPFQYDNALGKYIHTPGTVYKQRSEGFATTHKGLFGVNGISDISKIKKNKIVVWGDSYVEAHQVNDDEKMAQVITANLVQKGLGGKSFCFAVGMSGDSVADYYFEIPRYEAVIYDIVAHYIFITGLSDILPDQSTDNKKGLFRCAPLELSEDGWHPKFQELKTVFAKLHMSFVWQPLVSLPGTMKQLRFMPGKQERKSTAETDKKGGEKYSDVFLTESWHFLLKSLRAQTKHPLSFVYAPVLPKIRNGKISGSDLNVKYIELFAEIAAEYDIDVIYAGDEFLRYYENTGLFPRGFVNTEPGAGHFNRYGHSIVASIITDHFMNRKRLE